MEATLGSPPEVPSREAMAVIAGSELGRSSTRKGVRRKSVPVAPTASYPVNPLPYPTHMDKVPIENPYQPDRRQSEPTYVSTGPAASLAPPTQQAQPTAPPNRPVPPPLPSRQNTAGIPFQPHASSNQMHPGMGHRAFTLPQQSTSPYGHQRNRSTRRPVSRLFTGSPSLAMLPELLQVASNGSETQRSSALDHISTIVLANATVKLEVANAGIYLILKKLLFPGTGLELLRSALKCFIFVTFGSESDVKEQMNRANIAVDTHILLGHRNPEITYLACISNCLCKGKTLTHAQEIKLNDCIGQSLPTFFTDIGSNGSCATNPLLLPNLSTITSYLLPEENVSSFLEVDALPRIISYYGIGRTDLDGIVLGICSLCVRNPQGWAKVQSAGLVERIIPHLGELAYSHPEFLEGLCNSMIGTDNCLANPMLDAGFLQTAREALTGSLTDKEVGLHLSFLVIMASGNESVKHEILMNIQVERILECLDHDHTRIKALWIIYYLCIGNDDQKAVFFENEVTQEVLDLLSVGSLDVYRPAGRVLLALSSGSADQQAAVLNDALPFYLRLLSSYSVVTNPKGQVPFSGLLLLLRLQDNRDYAIKAEIVENLLQILAKGGNEFRFPCYSIIIAATQHDYFGGDPNLFYMHQNTPCEGLLTSESFDWKLHALKLKKLLFDGTDNEIIFALSTLMRFCWAKSVGAATLAWMRAEGVIDRFVVLVGHANLSIQQLARDAISWIQSKGNSPFLLLNPQQVPSAAPPRPQGATRPPARPPVNGKPRPPGSAQGRPPNSFQGKLPGYSSAQVLQQAEKLKWYLKKLQVKLASTKPSQGTAFAGQTSSQIPSKMNSALGQKILMQLIRIWQAQAQAQAQAHAQGIAFNQAPYQKIQAQLMATLMSQALGQGQTISVGATGVGAAGVGGTGTGSAAGSGTSTGLGSVPVFTTASGSGSSSSSVPGASNAGTSSVPISGSAFDPTPGSTAPTGTGTAPNFGTVPGSVPAFGSSSGTGAGAGAGSVPNLGTASGVNFVQPAQGYQAQNQNISMLQDLLTNVLHNMHSHPHMYGSGLSSPTYNFNTGDSTASMDYSTDIDMDYSTDINMDFSTDIDIDYSSNATYDFSSDTTFDYNSDMSFDYSSDMSSGFDFSSLGGDSGFDFSSFGGGDGSGGLGDMFSSLSF